MYRLTFLPTKSTYRLTFTIFVPTVPERIPLELRYGLFIIHLKSLSKYERNNEVFSSLPTMCRCSKDFGKPISAQLTDSIQWPTRCEVCGNPCNGFLFIFAPIKLSTPLIQAHFAESFRPVALGL